MPAEGGNWVYRVAAAGVDSNGPVLWYYFLVASPEGRQLVFIFALNADAVERFGPRDLAMIGSLEFTPLRTAAKEE